MALVSSAPHVLAFPLVLSLAVVAAAGADVASPTGRAAPARVAKPAPAVEPTPAVKPAPNTAPAAGRRRARFAAFSREGNPLARRMMIGISGVLMQAAPLRPRVVSLDPRDVGRSAAFGGLGVFGRYRPKPIVGIDLGVQSGSVRYRRKDADVGASQDQILADLGTALYLGRGDVAQFAVSAGLGGMYTLVRYNAEQATGRQAFGSAVFRLGVEAEFLLKRVAIVLSFRTHGVLTDRDRVRSKGALLDGASAADRRAPVASFATMLVGSLGLAYRF